MKNIIYNNNYTFTGLLTTKDDYGFDLVFSDKPCRADRLFIYPLSVALQNKGEYEVNINPSFSAEEIIDIFILRDKPEEDFKEFLSAYDFPELYKERKPYVTMEGAFANGNSKWKIVYPRTVSSLGLIDPKSYIRNGFELVSPKNGEVIGTIDYKTFLLYKAVENANKIWNSVTQLERYKLLENIQTQSKDAGIKIDSKIGNIKVVFPTRIVPDIKQISEDEYRITAETDIPNVDQQDFIKHFETRNEADNIYSVKDLDGNEVKILFNEEQKRILSDIKEQENDSTEELKEFIASPPENWNDEVVDTSKIYGDRVIGWHLYEPVMQLPDPKAHKNGWYDGAKDLVDYGNIPFETVPTEKRQSQMLDIIDNEEFLDYEKENNNKLKNYVFPLIPDGYRNGIQAKDYQKEGIAWMYALYSNQVPGCILADDMGLGKTFQVLSFLQAVSEKVKLILVVTPASLMDNWENEYYKFFPKAIYRIVTKNNDRYVLSSLLERQAKNEEIYEKYIFITNYETLRSNKQYLKIQWDITVLDEAQRIKNPVSLTNRTARGLQTSFRIAITGTPVENNFSDIWAIADFTCPGSLGTLKDFKAKFNVDDSDSDETIVSKGSAIRNLIGDSFLRRTKVDTLTNMPEKELHKIDEYMPSVQSSVYSQVLALTKDHSSLSDRLVILQMLKKTSDHQALIGPQFTPDTFAFEDTARTIILKKILYSIKEKNEKVIIFAEYCKTQEILADLIQKEFNIRASIFNGSVPLHSREILLNRFKSVEGFNVIIMSPIAAGVGLTIIEANHVIHFSRHWNPAKEDQATDRVYRIGQTKKVHVYNLIGRINGFVSFDEKLDKLLSYKQSIKGAALFPSARMDIKQTEFMADLIQN